MTDFQVLVYFGGTFIVFCICVYFSARTSSKIGKQEDCFSEININEREKKEEERKKNILKFLKDRELEHERVVKEYKEDKDFYKDYKVKVTLIDNTDILLDEVFSSHIIYSPKIYFTEHDEYLQYLYDNSFNPPSLSLGKDKAREFIENNINNFIIHGSIGYGSNAILKMEAVEISKEI